MVISWKRVFPDGRPDQYLATGSYSMNRERVTVEPRENIGSTLIITLAKESDVGEYVCEVSSNPPATLRHHVSIIVPPSVNILRPENANPEEIRLRAGEELALVCSGNGDPFPTITWTREKKRMPDGKSFVQSDTIIYKNVTRKFSGNYVCEGNNGPGRTARDSIKVNVLRKH